LVGSAEHEPGTGPAATSAPASATTPATAVEQERPVSYSLTRESFWLLHLGWRIALFVLGAALIGLVAAVATGLVTLP
jgi:hypothetical protein